MIYPWDEVKRLANLRKHGLDFLRARRVRESRYVWSVDSPRNGERRQPAFAYVLQVLAGLSVVFLPDGDHCRIVSLRPATRKERETYDAWLEENDHDDS